MRLKRSWKPPWRRILMLVLVTTATAHAVADDFAHTHINIAAMPAGDVKQGAISMTSSFMLVAARDDPIEVKLPLPPSTSDLRADAGKKVFKLPRSPSTMSLLCRYFDLGERNDAHLRHDMVAAAWSVMHTCCPVGSGVAITPDLLA